MISYATYKVKMKLKMKHRNSSYLRNSSLTLGCLDVKSAWGSGKKYFIAFQSFLTSPTLHPN